MAWEPWTTSATSLGASSPRSVRSSGEPQPLDGGITNRNFRVTLGGADYVIRRPGKDTDLLGIDREAERLANEAAAQLGIAPAVAAALDDCLVTRFIVCEPVQSQELRDGVEEVARALRSFHDSGIRLPTSFWVPDLLEDYAAIVRRRGGAVPGRVRRGGRSPPPDRRRAARARSRARVTTTCSRATSSARRATAAS